MGSQGSPSLVGAVVTRRNHSRWDFFCRARPNTKSSSLSGTLQAPGPTAPSSTSGFGGGGKSAFMAFPDADGASQGISIVQEKPPWGLEMHLGMGKRRTFFTAAPAAPRRWDVAASL